MNRAAPSFHAATHAAAAAAADVEARPRGVAFFFWRGGGCRDESRSATHVARWV